MSSSKSGGKPNVDHIIDGVAAVNMGSEEGPWEVSVRKSKNKGSGKPWAQQNTAPRPWGQPASRDNSGKAPAAASAWPQIGSAGRGNVRPQLPLGRAFPINSANSQPAIAAPLERGWNWNSRPGASTTRPLQDVHVEPEPAKKDDDNDDDIDNDDDDSDVVDSDDGDLLSEYEFDSDESVQSFESRKKNKWLTGFFKMLDNLTVVEINDPVRQWHCPACQNGPGAIDWYRGLQPLMTHAKTKGSTRVKLHRELAELLDEELRQRGTSVIPAGEAFGRWNGMKDAKDREIIWPPMIVIMNTKLEQGDDDRWIGMGNQELLDYFSSYAAAKARHSYGPQGHRGMSVLIFESSAMGYLEAERLHNNFEEQGTDRKAWDQHRVLFNAGGNRQLYGYMAEKHDLDFFNQHTQVKTRLKYDMRSYQEMVVSQLRQMKEDNQQLIWFKDKVAKEKKHSKALEESFGLVSEKLRRTLEENRIVRQRSKVHHEQNKQEMDYQENFFNNQLKSIHDERAKKEESFEMLQQEERQKVKQSKARREDEVQNFIKSQDKEIEEFVVERDKLMKVYEEEKAALKKRYYDEEVELEKKIDAQLNQLMENYTSHHSQ